MYPAMGMMGGAMGQMQQLLLSPLTRFAQASLIHKLLAAGAGAGLAYYLNKKGLSETTVALSALAGAYGSSVAMNYPSMMGLPAGMPAGSAFNPAMMHGALPAAHMGQISQASRVLTAMGVRPGALAPARQPVVPGMPQMAPGGGQWSALG